MQNTELCVGDYPFLCRQIRKTVIRLDISFDEQQVQIPKDKKKS